jgi:hypothetical protein
MVCFSNEALVRIGPAAVDGFIAAAAVGRQRTGGLQPTRLLPPKWGSSLHDVAGDGAG